MRQVLTPIITVLSVCLGTVYAARLEMKQLIFMVAMLAVGSLGSLYHPFWGVLLYYTFAVLRPQYLWSWSLPGGVRWSLFAAMIVLVGCVLNFGKLLERRRLNAVMVLIVLYGLWLILSILCAHEPSLAMAWGMEYGKILLIGLVTSVVIRHVWQIKVMTAMILVMLGYIAWEINYLYLFDGRLDIFHKGYGGLDNNGAGLMLAMGVPIAYAFGVAAPRPWQKAVSWLLALFMLHAVLMSYSRGAMLALGLTAIWILIQHRPRHQAAALALAGCLAVSVLAGAEIRSRFTSMLNYERDYSAQSRFDSWEAGWEIAKEHPITGQGIRNSNLYTRNYGADVGGRTIHSQYLQIAADSGIPAMLTYMTLLGAAVVYTRRSRRGCLDYLEDFQQAHPLRAPDPSVRLMANIALACQCSLILFAFGGLFLSVEVFELPWLLIVLAGVMPNAVQNYLDFRVREDQRMFAEPLPPAPRPNRTRRPQRTQHTGLAMPHLAKGLSHP